MARVLLVFEPPDGGVAENVLQIASRMADHGHEAELAGPPGASIYPRLAAAPIARLPLVRGYGRPWLDLRALAGLVRLIRTRRYDVVHCHSAKAGVLGRIAAFLTRTPVVYSPHSLPFVGDFSEARRAFATLVERLLGPLTTVLLCVCEWERELALEHRLVPSARVRVVHNGCEPCPPAEPDAELAAFAGGGPVAAAITVLRAQKSVDVLIDAAPRVLERVPDARIAVIGDGPLRAELEARAAALGLDAEPRFRFLGFRPPAARYLASTAVYVLPSAWEAFPIGVLEAQACGVPQVATDVGGTGEAVDADTGLLVPKRDPQALSDALSELLADPGRRAALSGASRRRHAERWGVERMAAATATVYEEVVAGLAAG